MATFVLNEGFTFQANHFGMQGTGHDGISTDVAFHSATFPTAGSTLHQSFYDGPWSGEPSTSTQVGLVTSFEQIVLPFSNYDDPFVGEGWGGSAWYEQSIAGSFAFIDYTQPEHGAPGVIGTLQNGFADFQLFERYTRQGDPQSGSYRLIWEHTATGNVSWQLWMGDDDVTLGDGDDFFMDPAGALEIDLGGGNDILDSYEADPNSTVGDIGHAGAGDDTIHYQGNYGKFYLEDGDDEIGSYGNNNRT